MSRGDLRLKVVNGSIAYDPPDSAPNSGAGTVHQVGDVFDFPEGPDISRFGNDVVVHSGDATPAESPAEAEPEEVPSTEETPKEDSNGDFQGAVEAVMFSRSFRDLCKLAKEEGIKKPKKLKSKQLVAEAIVNSRRG